MLPTAEQLQAGLGRKAPFGSNGTALGGEATTTGRGMLLGNPHFPCRGRYRFTQSHLTIPGAYDVAVAMLHGSPVVNIGWNRDVAWTHTVSTGYRLTPYEYRTAPGAPTTYLTEAGPEQLERREVRVAVRQPDGSVGEVVEDLYRTDEATCSAPLRSCWAGRRSASSRWPTRTRSTSRPSTSSTRWLRSRTSPG